MAQNKTTDPLALLQQQIEAAQRAYNLTQQTQLNLPDIVRQKLGERSPEYNLPKEGLQARFGDQNSPLYIANPFVRQAVIDKALSSQQNAFTTVADKVGNIFSNKALIQQQDLSGLKDKYGLLQAERKAQAEAAQQAFENKIKLQELAISRAKIGGGDGDTSTAANYANMVSTGQLTLAQVPASVRGDVVNYVANNGIDILPLKARESIAAVNSGRGVLDQIKTYSDTLNKTSGTLGKVFGGFASSVGGKLGRNQASSQASAALGDIKKSLVSTLSRALGEKGVLTDFDVKRAQALIPSPYDTRQEAQRKIKTLETFFNNLEQRAYETATGTPESLGLKSGASANSGKTSTGLTYTITK